MTPERFEDLAERWQRATRAYYRAAERYYRALRYGIEVEYWREKKDLARIELESIGQEVLKSIADEKDEIDRRQAALHVSRTMTLSEWTASQNRLRQLEDLEAFFAEV